MKLVLHLLGKDLRRMRWWLAGWIWVLALPVVLGALVMALDPFVQEDWNLPKLYAALVGFEVLAGFLLVVLWLQDDVILEPNAFWRTRPISGPRLLAAKTLGVLTIIGVTPVLVSLPWWLWCGFGAKEIAAGVVNILVNGVLIAAPAALIAVLTDSLTRALLWTPVLVAAGVASIVFLQVPMLPDRRIEMELWIFRTLLTTGVLVVGFGAITALVFLLRRRGWWLAVGGAVVLVAIGIATQWPHLPGDNEPRERHPELAAGVAVRPDRAIVQRGIHRDAVGIPNRLVTTRLTASLPAAGLVLKGLSAAEQWNWPEGVQIKRRSELNVWQNRVLGFRHGVHDVETQEWMQGQAVPSRQLPKSNVPSEISPNELRLVVVSWLPPSFVARMKIAPPVYDAHLWFSLARPEFGLELPIEVTRWQARDSHGLKIERVVGNHDNVVLLVLETQSAVRDAWWRVPWLNRDDPNRRRSCVTFNRERNEYLSAVFEKSREVSIKGVHVRWREVTFERPRVIRDGQWTPFPEWLTQARLALPTLREEAVFSRRVLVEKYEIEEAENSVPKH